MFWKEASAAEITSEIIEKMEVGRLSPP